MNTIRKQVTLPRKSFAALTMATLASVWSLLAFQSEVQAQRGEAIVDIDYVPSSSGYWTTNADGWVLAHQAPHFGDSPELLRGEAVRSLSPSPTGLGYWLFSDRGRVFAYGDAEHFGDLSTIRNGDGVSIMDLLNGPIVGSVATPTGRGYWMVASDGGIFAIGDAGFFGSMGGVELNGQVVGLAPTPTNNGYWLVAEDGGTFAFGDATFYGSMGGVPLNSPVGSLIPQSAGYMMVAADGGIFNFGESRFHGSLGGQAIPRPIVASAVLHDRSGYLLVDDAGAVYSFGAAETQALGEVEPVAADPVPDPPVGARIVDYGDQFLVLEWDAPPTAGDFSAILAYEVSIGGQRVRVDAPATTVRVGAGGQGSPLINGTDYEFSVRAQNSATVDNGWGAFSAVSGSERPSRYPDPPTGVSAANTGDGGQPRLTVSWSAPGFDGGRSILNYQVCQAGTSTCQTVTGTSATFDLPRNQTVRYVVVAFNSDKNRDNSDPSAASPAATTVGNPDTPRLTGYDLRDDDSVVVYASSNNGSGCSEVFVEYSIDGGVTWQRSFRFTGIEIGVDYRIIYRAGLEQSCGNPEVSYRSGIGQVIEFRRTKPPVQPTIRAEVDGTAVRFVWSTNREWDGQESWAALLSGDGLGCSGAVPDSIGATGATAWIDIGFSATRTCTITVFVDGRTGPSATAVARTPTPVRRIVLSQGVRATGPGPREVCDANGFACWHVNISGSNFLPNAALQVRCEGDSRWFSLTTTNGSGSFGTTRSACWNDGRVGQTIWVRDALGQASGVSRWR